MKQSQYNELLNLFEDIKGVDKMIQLHHSDKSGFMLDQYKAKKEKLVSAIIDQLASPPLVSARSIHTIRKVIDRFYGDEMRTMDRQKINDDLSKLEMALM